MMDARIQKIIHAKVVIGMAMGKTISVEELLEQAIQEAARVLSEIAMAEQVDYANSKHESDRAYNLACDHISEAILTAVGIKD